MNTFVCQCKLNISLGIMGKRTRFQEKDIAQLVLTVKRDEKMSVGDNYKIWSKEQLPKVGITIKMGMYV